MNKPLSQMISEFEQQLTNVELRSNPKIKVKLERLKELVSRFELSQRQTKKMKGLVVEYK